MLSCSAVYQQGAAWWPANPLSAVSCVQPDGRCWAGMEIQEKKRNQVFHPSLWQHVQQHLPSRLSLPALPLQAPWLWYLPSPPLSQPKDGGPAPGLTRSLVIQNLSIPWGTEFLHEIPLLSQLTLADVLQFPLCCPVTTSCGEAPVPPAGHRLPFNTSRGLICPLPALPQLWFQQHLFVCGLMSSYGGRNYVMENCSHCPSLPCREPAVKHRPTRPWWRSGLSQCSERLSTDCWQGRGFQEVGVQP